MSSLIQVLVGHNLHLTATEIVKNGTKFVEGKTDVNLRSGVLSEEDINKLRQFETDNAEYLLLQSLANKKVLKAVSDWSWHRSSQIISAILAISATFLTFLFFYMVVFVKLEAGASRDIVVYVLGVLSAMESQIFSYYFGSSVGSKEKTEAMIKGMPTITPPTPPTPPEPSQPEPQQQDAVVPKG